MHTLVKYQISLFVIFFILNIQNKSFSEEKEIYDILENKTNLVKEYILKKAI